MQQGDSDRYVVVLGDSNLNIDLPFGVQIISISKISVHDSYQPFSEYHDGDIGELVTKVNSSFLSKEYLLSN